MVDPTVKVIIVAIIIIAVIYFVMSKQSPPTQNIDDFVQRNYAIPLKYAYKPLLTAPDNRYVYYPEGNVYLLPYEYLDFNDPFNRWMYYHYYGFYSGYYPYYFPFVGGYNGNNNNYGYGGFVYDGHVNRTGGGKGHRVVNGIHDRSGRGIHSIIHPISRPVNHPGSGGKPSSGRGH
jgi:hypothetical protein